jgi:hypothetical protein
MYARDHKLASSRFDFFRPVRKFRFAAPLKETLQTIIHRAVCANREEMNDPPG